MSFYNKKYTHCKRNCQKYIRQYGSVVQIVIKGLCYLAVNEY